MGLNNLINNDEILHENKNQIFLSTVSDKKIEDAY